MRTIYRLPAPSPHRSSFSQTPRLTAAGRLTALAVSTTRSSRIDLRPTDPIGKKNPGHLRSFPGRCAVTSLGFGAPGLGSGLRAVRERIRSLLQRERG